MLIIKAKKMGKEITRDVISVLIVLGMLASLFFPVMESGASLLRYASAAVIGFYFGLGQLPLAGAFRRK